MWSYLGTAGWISDEILGSKKVASRVLAIYAETYGTYKTVPS